MAFGRWEKSGLKKALQQLEMMEEGDPSIADQITSLKTISKDHTRKIEKMEATLVTLIDLLLDAELIDGERFARILEVTLGSVEKEKKPAAPKKIAIPLTTCNKCGKEFPADQILYSSIGEVCQACYAQLK